LPKALRTISITFVATCALGAVWTVLLIVLYGDGNGLGPFFAGIAHTAIVLLLECVVFAIVYRKERVLAIGLALPPVLVVAYVLYSVVSERLETARIDAPPRGPLPVSNEAYQKDTTLLIATELADTLHQREMIEQFGDTLQSVAVDTVYYSPSLDTLYGIVILRLKNKALKSEPDFQVGYRTDSGWKLHRSLADSWNVGFASDSALKHEVKQYLFTHFSINGSSHRPELWKDRYIFN
jgi:hypothetical protein